MDILYNLLIQPLVVVYDVLYTVLYRLIENPVLTILAFSVSNVCVCSSYLSLFSDVFLLLGLV
jgi:hypothetical protein